MNIPRRWIRSVAVSILVLAPAGVASAQELGGQHAISMYGETKYPADFTHFDYVNLDAPKGGTLTLSGSGTFDSLNPFILKGTPAAGLTLMFETLMTPSLDEPFTYYGLIAEKVETPEDRSWVKFTLDPRALWHDGTPITAEDVIFSFETLTTKGHPQYRSYYASVVKAEKTGEREVTFTFDGEVNRELPLIMGQLSVLPKHYYEGRDFEKTSLEPPLASGPYKIKSFEPGRSIVYERVPDYWGADLPVNEGRYNYDEIRYEYYRDPCVEP
jgi:microcin C transport system substrate-binding protein